MATANAPVHDRIAELVRNLIEHNGSDIHIVPNNVASLRLMGSLVKTSKYFTVEDTTSLYIYLKGKLPPRQQQYVDNHLKDRHNTGFSVIIENRRFRVNVSRMGEGLYIVMREIKEHPPLLHELSFPDRVVKGLNYVATRPAGLFLVVGPTGSGKSTTLAAIIRTINESRSVNIITLEDPIEYVYKPEKAQVVQKELGRDFNRFSDGLHSALREDPDVILVGEIRDESSFELCLKAAETGHLVFSTLHTLDAVATVQRLCAMGTNERWVRDRLAQVLIGVIAQRLAKRKDGKGRVAVCELLIANNAVRSLIKEGKDLQLKALIDTLPYSQSFNKSIAELCKNGVIDRETAYMLTNDLKDLESRLEECSVNEVNAVNTNGGMDKTKASHTSVGGSNVRTLVFD